MKFCKIGIHKYKELDTQTLKNKVGFGCANIMRKRLKCIYCGKIKNISLLIGTDYKIINDDKLDWV